MKNLASVNVVGEPDASATQVPESVIHEIWRLQQFRADDLQTADGQRVVVLHTGRLNEDQGPDFLEARVIIGSATWAGAVEIHRTSADWEKHGHQHDVHYDAVILHVTLFADRRTGLLTRADGTRIPEIVLFPRLKESLRRLGWQFRKGGSIFFACHEHWVHVPETVIAPFLKQLARDRLRRKTERLGERFLSMPDLDQVLYEEVMRSLGYIQNAEAMVLLARRIPLVALRSVDDPRDALALLLGIAGLLRAGTGSQLSSEPDDDYKRRFAEHVAVDAPLPLPNTIWRRGRLRPANDPRRRIVQAVLLFGRSGPLGERPVERVVPILESNDPSGFLRNLLRVPPDVATYLTPTAGSKSLQLGTDRSLTIAANALLPILCLAHEQQGSLGIEDKVLSILGKLPVVMDRIVRRYSADRGRPASTAVAQGVHELSQSWCGKGRCRECPIWKHIAA